MPIVKIISGGQTGADRPSGHFGGCAGVGTHA
jgi:hypothetical protein